MVIYFVGTNYHKMGNFRVIQFSRCFVVSRDLTQNTGKIEIREIFSKFEQLFTNLYRTIILY